MQLTRAEAARVALYFQLLSRPRPKASESSILALVRALGNLQIDTINVVERSHHLVLNSRLEDYRGELLERLLLKRRLVEYWTNVAAIIPREDYPYYLYRWTSRADGWLHNFWLPKNRDYLEEIRRRIPRDQPFTTEAFAKSLQRRGRGWSGSELSRALNILHLDGSLVIHHREGFRKFYAARRKTPAQSLDEKRVIRFLITRALSSMGIANQREIRLPRLMPPTAYRQEIEAMTNDTTLLTLRVEGLPVDYYMLSDQREEIEEATGNQMEESQATLLSPFDNLIINRERAERLFGFYPRFEAYVPKAKRKYGYYCMPILLDERLVGYVDPRLDRKEGIMTFNVLNLTQRPTDNGRDALVEEFKRFVLFHNGQSLQVRVSDSTRLSRDLELRANKAIRSH